MGIWKTRKGVSMAIEGVGYLLLAVIALIILWIFLQMLAPDLKIAIVKFTKALICTLCKEILGWWKGIFPFCWGCKDYV